MPHLAEAIRAAVAGSGGGGGVGLPEVEVSDVPRRAARHHLMAPLPRPQRHAHLRVGSTVSTHACRLRHDAAELGPRFGFECSFGVSGQVQAATLMSQNR